ncbi:MAG: hypothetical protein OXI87_22135 [Albidovulum sp.]|nr:hypothetical protein [Albidovulum sp.]
MRGGRSGARGRLGALFRSEADIIPEPDKGVLRARILGTASNAGNAAIESPLEEPCRTRTIYPGTGPRMVYELPGSGTEPPEKHS